MSKGKIVIRLVWCPACGKLKFGDDTDTLIHPELNKIIAQQMINDWEVILRDGGKYKNRT